MEKMTVTGPRQTFEKILMVVFGALCLMALGMFYWIVLVFVNSLAPNALKASAVVAISLIPLGAGIGALVGFRFGRRDTNMVLGGFWRATETIIPQMNAHAQEMSDIRVTSARRMYREDPHSLAIDASVGMPPLITERIQETREEEV